MIENPTPLKGSQQSDKAQAYMAHHHGSAHNPDNIGLQTSPVKIIQLSQAKKQAAKYKGGARDGITGRTAEMNLKAHTIANTAHQLLGMQGK